MGKYTNLARKTEEPRPQEKHVPPSLYNTYKHSIEVVNKVSPAAALPDPATPLRGYAVNAVVRCIHRNTPDECAVCSGYVGWLIEDEARLRRAQANPEGTRREFWRSSRGEA